MKIGQGIFLKLTYADGGEANYQRPFLIMRIEEDKIYMLNISSLQGKEYKLGYPSNHKIKRYKPPFIRPSLIKLDAVYVIENSSILEEFVLDEGRAIHPTELRTIRTCFEEYKSHNHIVSCYHSAEQLLSFNTPDSFRKTSSSQIASTRDD